MQEAEIRANSEALSPNFLNGENSPQAYVIGEVGVTPFTRVQLWQPSGLLHVTRADSLLVPSKAESFTGDRGEFFVR